MATSAIRSGMGAQGAPLMQQVVQIGLFGGLAALLVSLVGMVESFSRRDVIGGFITTGQTLLLVLIAFAGYFAARRAIQHHAPPTVSIGYGGLAGLLASGVLALFMLLGTQINFRAVLVNASPTLYEIFSFGQGMGAGVGILLGAGLVVGLLGGMLHALPSRWSRPLLWGISGVLLMGLLQELVKLIITTGISSEVSRWFYARSGLTLQGAAVLFVVPFLLTMAWSFYGAEIQLRYHRLPGSTRRGVRLATLALGLLAVLLFPQFFGRFPAEVMNNVALLGILMGLGLNIVVGFAGLLDLGYVGFFAIGAYTMAILTSPESSLSHFTFWTALPFAVLVSTLAGIILGIPVLKMRGDYLAIVTLGFGEIIRILFLSDALSGFVGGARGIVGIPNPSVAGFVLNTPERLYYLLVVAVALTWFISTRLRDSRLGRAWMAIREDEDVAEAMGIDLVATKLTAFGTGAAMAGFGGAIFASKLQSIVPQTFDLLISVNALAIIIIGGLASIPGVVVGAMLLIGLPELLREFAEYRLWVYGALLVVMMLYRPEGFVPEPTRRRELHGHDDPTEPDSATIP